MNIVAKRTRIEDLRRTELITAAHRVFMIHGLSGLTTAHICAEAGMSPGILAYYFKGKEDVLFAMVRLNNRLLLEDIVLRLNATNTTWGRLLAIVEGNFPAKVYTPNVANAWLSVIAVSAKNPRYAKLQALFYRRLRSNLASVFKGHLPPDRVASMTQVVSSMIDGLWLQKAAHQAPDRDAAVALILKCVTALLTDDERNRLQGQRQDLLEQAMAWR